MNHFAGIFLSEFLQRAHMMNRLLICGVFIVILIIIVSGDRKFLPHLPFGEYRINYKGFLHCNEPSITNNIVSHFYLSKKSANSTEIKGNITFLAPLDDTYDINFNYAVKDSIGGWKDNAFLYKSHKGCSTFRNLLGKSWTPFMEGLGIKNPTCPIPAGSYLATGADTALLTKNSGFPKLFYYGTYKVRSNFFKKNDSNICFILVVDIKRLWETD